MSNSNNTQKSFESLRSGNYIPRLAGTWRFGNKRKLKAYEKRQERQNVRHKQNRLWPQCEDNELIKLRYNWWRDGK